MIPPQTDRDGDRAARSAGVSVPTKLSDGAKARSPVVVRLDGTGLKAPPPLLQGVYYAINILAEGVQSVQRDARIAGRMPLKMGASSPARQLLPRSKKPAMGTTLDGNQSP